MAIKNKPKGINVATLPSKKREDIIKLTYFIDRRGKEETHIHDIEREFQIGYYKAWGLLDLAWECGLIAKVKTSHWTCYWRARGRGPSFIDRTSQ